MAENWILFGEYFKLPLLVSWDQGKRTVARVELHPGMAWLECFKAAAGGLLGETAFSTGTGWFVTLEDLNEIAAPAPAEMGVEDLVIWNPERLLYSLPSDGLLEDAGGAKERREFLAAFVDAIGLTVFKTMDELELFFFALCNFMMSWVGEKNRALDLGWCKLFAAPLWTGWQPRVEEQMRQWPQKKRNDLSKIMALLYYVRNRIGDPKTKTEVRSVHCTMKKEWWDYSTRAELSRRRHLRDYQYFKIADNRLKGVILYLVENYESYRAKWNYARYEDVLGNTRIGDLSGRVRERRPQSRAGNYVGDGSRFALAVERRNKAWAKKRARALARSNEVVLSVPAAQPEGPDLRNQGSDVGKSEDKPS